MGVFSIGPVKGVQYAQAAAAVDFEYGAVVVVCSFPSLGSGAIQIACAVPHQPCTGVASIGTIKGMQHGIG